MTSDKINPIQDVLKFGIHNAINNSVLSVIKACSIKKTKPQEPDFIASLTCDFTPNLFHILKSFFPKTKFAVTGVFCHQKPIVDISEPKNPEIGDILFVYIYTNIQGEKRYNSLLLQAKMASSPMVKNSTNDAHQLKLYNEWPEFTYHRAGRLNGTKRNIIPKTFNDGAQYLLINSYVLTPGIKKLRVPMACAIAEENLAVHNSLATELVEFLKFKSGRTFEKDPNVSSDDWTKMIWDLLEISKTAFSRRKNSRSSIFARQASFQSDVTLNFTGGDIGVGSIYSPALKDQDPTSFKDNDDFYGISVIVIESNDSEVDE